MVDVTGGDPLARRARSYASIDRLIVVNEAGGDAFWFARWLRARGIETHVIHPTSITVSREHCRSWTDCLDSVMLMRVPLG